MSILTASFSIYCLHIQVQLFVTAIHDERTYHGEGGRWHVREKIGTLCPLNPKLGTVMRAIRRRLHAVHVRQPSRANDVEFAVKRLVGSMQCPWYAAA